MKNKLFLSIGVISCVAAIGVAALQNSNFNKPLFSHSTEYTLTLNSTAFAASSLTTSYQTEITQNFGNDKPTMHYYLAKKNGSNNLVLAPAGKVFNYSTSATYGGRVTNISSVKVAYSGGTLYVQEGLAGGATRYGEKQQLTNNTAKSLSSNPNYIMITNSVAATTITSITVTYTCSDPGYTVNRMGTQYNCKSAEGTVYTLTRSGSNVTFNGHSGTISLTNSGGFTISMNNNSYTYTGTISSDYQRLEVVSKTGSGPTISSFNRIYVVDNFESYTKDGNTYASNPSHATAQSEVYLTAANATNPASDLRAVYYSDYGGSGNNTWVESSNFNVPTSTDFLNKTTAVKHGGSQSVLIKASTGGWMRHWSSEIFNQNQHYNFGNGNKFSFWAHGAYKNSTCTTASTDNIELRAQVYYQNFVITDSNRNSTTYGSGVKTFTIPKNSDWTEYTIDIDPNKSVYAVCFMMNNQYNGSTISANAYVPIDDITIYTQPMYETPKTYDETSTRFTKSYHGSVKILTYTFTIKVALGANGYVYAYAGEDMEPTGYTITGSTIVITTAGSYSGATFGTWTGTLSNNNNRITIPKSGIDGDVKNYVKSDQIILNADTILADGSEGSLATLENSITRQYYSGSWTTDSSNADRFTFRTDYHIQGNNSIRVRPYATNNMRIIMNTTLATSVSSIDSVAFWFYVPAGTTYNLQIYTYKDTVPNSANDRRAQQFSRDYDGNDPNDVGWHYLNMGLNVAGGYGKNFAIFIGTNANQTILDYITYF